MVSSATYNRQPKGLVYILGRRFFSEMLAEGEIPDCQTSGKQIIFSYGPVDYFQATVTFAWLEYRNGKKLDKPGNLKASYLLEQLYQVEGEAQRCTILEIGYYLTDYTFPGELEIHHYAKPVIKMAPKQHPLMAENKSHYLMLGYLDVVLDYPLSKNEHLAKIVEGVHDHTHGAFCRGDLSGSATWSYSDVELGNLKADDSCN